jgi:hypothetical protein
MNRVVAHLLTRLYPRAWRERYGVEFEALLQNGRGDLGTSANVLWSAFSERVFPTLGGNVDPHSNSFAAIMKRTSAFLLVAMSFTALAMLGAAYIVGLATGHGGLVREPDEGAVAHLWQILMAGQMPIVGFFAVKWLPRAPKQTLHVLALHVGAALASMAPVFFLNL